MQPAMLGIGPAIGFLAPQWDGAPDWGAFPSIAVPDTIAPGSTHAVTVQFQNTGNVPTDYRVQAWYGNPANPSQNYTGQVAYGDAQNVQPGATATVSVNGLAAPAQTGIYAVMVMIYGEQSGAFAFESSAWVGGLALLTSSTGVQVNNVTVSLSAAVGLPAGFPTAPVPFSQNFTFSLTPTNTAGYPVDWQLNAWVDNPASPGNALTPGNGAPYPPYVSANTANSAQHTFLVTLLAPVTPGTYTIKYHLYERQAGTSQWYTPQLPGADANGDVAIGTVTVPVALGRPATITLAQWS